MKSGFNISNHGKEFPPKKGIKKSPNLEKICHKNKVKV